MNKSFDSSSLPSLLLESSNIIYNNMAEFTGLKGRVTLEISINPNPIILWEFECVDRAEVCKKKILFKDYFPPNKIEKIKANNIEIVYPICKSISGKSGGDKDIYSELRASGFSLEMRIGDMAEKLNALHFYIPNFRIHSQSREHNIKNNDPRWEFDNESTFIFDVDFLNDWVLSFETKAESIKWLENRFSNKGTKITTIGKIWAKKETKDKKLEFVRMHKELETLFLLLSFACGGHIKPIIYNGFNFKAEDRSEPSKFIYFLSNGKIDSVEDLGTSWFIAQSDLVGLIECYEKFSSMLSDNNWQEPFNLILANYFIAISARSWQIAASSIGTVIERLAYLLLVEEEKDRNKKDINKKLFKVGQSKARLEKTLEIIGLIKKRSINDIDHIVEFIDTRNDAVHPRSKNVPEKERWEHIRYGIQWAEEILLWRIGYSGWYLSRISKSDKDNMPYNAGLGRFVPRYYVDYKKKTP
jgi:hypothetical protein